MKCDLHIHSQFSDGKLSIPEIVDLYGQNGFGAIAVTDHLCEQKNLIGKVSHSMKYSLCEETFDDYLEVLQEERKRAWVDYEMLLIPGFEITKNSFLNHRSAHVLILGVEEFIDPDLPVEEILRRAQGAGGLTIAAHPFHTGGFEFQTFHLWSRRNEYKDLIDAWEINCRKTVCKDVLQSGLRLIANSDFHHELHFSSWKTKIYSEKTQTGIFQAIRQQKLDFFLDA